MPSHRTAQSKQYSLHAQLEWTFVGSGPLQDFERGKLTQLLISLHSWSNELHDEIVAAPGAAIETKAGITNALKEGLRVSVNQVIDCRNIDTMYSSALELQKFGVHSLSFTRALSPLDAAFHVGTVTATRFVDEFIKCSDKLAIPVVSLLPIPYCSDPRVKDLKGKLHCTGGISTAVVSCYGDLRLCPHDTKIWGNVFAEALGSIWQRIVMWRPRDLDVPPTCTDCAFVLDCRGGCRIAAKLCCGDYRAKDPWARSAVTDYRRRVTFDELDPDSVYALMPDIRWRQQNDVFFLHSRNGDLLVNSDGLEFVQRLPDSVRTRGPVP